ncbi:MAG TPA: HigA family addiction module antitoxin [Thermoanaerobaculia bacterium]|nr:HigA family addiction module antitoxin [Thermoanaerobaculia bacterium]
MEKLKPITPGELLLEEFLLPMRLSQDWLAREAGLPRQWISEIVTGQRAIDAETDLLLCRVFGVSNGYWLRARLAYDMEVATHTAPPQLRRSELPVARAATGRPLPSLTGADTQRILDEEEWGGAEDQPDSPPGRPSE